MMNMDFQQFSDQHWRRAIPETYAAFAKAAEVLEATPMPKPKRMPRRPLEPPNRRITHHKPPRTLSLMGTKEQIDIVSLIE